MLQKNGEKYPAKTMSLLIIYYKKTLRNSSIMTQHMFSGFTKTLFVWITQFYSVIEIYIII